MFIALEGGEGAGKTTQRETLVSTLRSKGFDVIQTREPGGTPFSEEIRELLLRPRDEEIDPFSELLLFFAARKQHVEKVIKPALMAGKIVICDRFTDSTYAYQVFGYNKIPLIEVRKLEMLTLGGFGPDVTVLFDLPVDVGMSRAARRGALDRMELMGTEFFERVRQGFLSIKDIRVNDDPSRIYRVIDASKSLSEVTAEIVSLATVVEQAYQQKKA